MKQIQEIVNEIREYLTNIGPGEHVEEDVIADFANRIEKEVDTVRTSISDALESFEICDWEYEECGRPKPCPKCGSKAAIFCNTHYGAFCTNPSCDNSMLGSRKQNMCWRTNAWKACVDWDNI